MYDLRTSLSDTAEKILNKKFGVSTTVHFNVSLGEGRGDLTTTVALQKAKELKKSPKDVAEPIAEALRETKGVETVEVAGNGYINVTLSAQVLSGVLNDAVDACEPKKVSKKDAPVIIEFSAPNIAKPLGIHHIIGTTLGQTIVNLYRHAGYNVISWNYIGDWGTQFGKLAVAYKKWGGEKPVSEFSLDELLALYVKFHEEAAKDPTLEDQGREAFLKLEKGDKTLRTFWQDTVTVTKASLAGLYSKLHVSFDLDLGESFYEDKMDPTIEEGKRKGVFVEGKDGALIVEFPEETKMPPYLVQKGDGGTLYSTRDLAQMRYRIDTYHPKSILILTDIAQKLHFEQLVATCRKLEWELPEFENVLFGRMRFADKSMSTRKGNVLKLEHVLEEAVERADQVIRERGENIQTDTPQELAEMMGIGALVYGVLSQNRKMDMVFDWDKMLSFEGNSAPYLQYTYARGRSVLRKAGMDDPPVVTATYTLSMQERTLTKMLAVFGDVVESSRSEHLPHKLCQHLYEICQAYNAFYNSNEILKAESAERAYRLSLTSVTCLVLRTGAHLLTLRVPERM